MMKHPYVLTLLARIEELETAAAQLQTQIEGLEAEVIGTNGAYENIRADKWRVELRLAAAQERIALLEEMIPQHYLEEVDRELEHPLSHLVAVEQALAAGPEAEAEGE